MIHFIHFILLIVMGVLAIAKNLGKGDGRFRWRWQNDQILREESDLVVTLENG